jgi:hypothetical protein
MVVHMKFFSRSSAFVKPATELSTHEWAEYNLPADLALASGDDQHFDVIDAHQRLAPDDDVI